MAEFPDSWVTAEEKIERSFNVVNCDGVLWGIGRGPSEWLHMENPPETYR